MKNQKDDNDFGGQQENHKRKWPYTNEDNSYQEFLMEKNNLTKKCMIAYDYDSNYQHSISTSNESQAQHLNSMNNGTAICNQQQSAQILNSIEISENIEYVNILYEDDLLTNIQAPVATETNFINFEPNWGNADILDLDQRNYYYEATNPNVNDLNGQMAQTSPQEPTNHSQQYHVHHHQTDTIQCQLQNSASNNQIQTVTEYEVIQTNFGDGNDNDQDIGRSNLPAVHDDSEDKNLSWLYNYKLNELPHLSPEVNRSRTETGLQVDKLIQEATSGENDNANQQPNADSSTTENPTHLPKKPPFTYTELIEYALEDKGELTVSGIYNWISDRFPFYKSNDDRWKNSVRHNLSINPHFRKGNKAPQGAGHLWIISTRDSEANLLAWEHKKQRLELFFKMEKTFGQTEDGNSENQHTQDETTVAVANLTSILEQSESPKAQTNGNGNGNVSGKQNKRSDDDLKKCAGEILNGVKRTVEVQAIHPDNTFNFQNQTINLDFPDYLNPVPKDQIVHECGLKSSRNNNNDFCSEYFVADDMEPIELGINMNGNAENDDDGLFGDEFNLNYFITPGSNIMT